MIIKFECLNCKHQFDANEVSEVLCPNCHSDNVRPYKKSLNKYIAMAGIFILALLLGFAIPKLFNSRKGESKIEVAKNDSISVFPDTVEKDLPIVTDVVNPVSVKLVSSPQYDRNSKTYSFKVIAMNVKENCMYHFELLDAFDANKVVANSSDGIFSKIQPSPDGTYQVIVKGDNMNVKCEPFVVAGFIVQKEIPKNEKMSSAQLQSLINAQSGTLLGSNPSISPSCSIRCTNLKSGDSAPKNFGGVYEKLIFEWQSVTVTHVDYDDMNRINSITLNVNYPD